MNYYSQRDDGWGDLRINGTNSKMEDYGCFITALAMLANKRPDEALRMLEAGGGLAGDLVKSKEAAQILGLEFKNAASNPLGKYKTPQEIPCIAEVDFSPSPGKQQHFVVFLGDAIVDPWTGTERPVDTYEIMNYRGFSIDWRNEEIQALKAKCKEWEAKIAVIGEVKKEIEDLQAVNDKLQQELGEKKEKPSELSKRASSGAWVAGGSGLAIGLANLLGAELGLSEVEIGGIAALLTAIITQVTKHLNNKTGSV